MLRLGRASPAATNWNMHRTSLPARKVGGLHVAAHGRQLDLQPVELLCHTDLAPEPAGLGQAEGEVEHVVFVVGGLGHLVVHVGVGDDDVAGRAGAGPAAGALHLEIVGLGHVEQVVALADLEGVLAALLINKGYVESVFGGGGVS